MHEKLTKMDLFPRIPQVIDRSDYRVKFYSPFGGIVSYINLCST